MCTGTGFSMPLASSWHHSVVSLPLLCFLCACCCKRVSDGIMYYSCWLVRADIEPGLYFTLELYARVGLNINGLQGRPLFLFIDSVFDLFLIRFNSFLIRFNSLLTYSVVDF